MKLRCILKETGLFFCSLLLAFLFLEMVFRLIGIPRGAHEHVESVVLEERLPVKKPAGEIRVFTYGESTMHGAQYAPESTPAKWLELYLKDFLPEKNIRVVNFARMGRGVDYTRTTFKDTLPYHPDIAIFYNGHNDFLPDERMDEIESVREPWATRAREVLKESRFIYALYRLVIRYRQARDRAAPKDIMGHRTIEIPADQVGGAEPVLRTDPFFARNLAFFEKNIRSIMALGKKHHVPVFFVRPVCNLKDLAPIQSVHLRKLTGDESAAFEEAVKQGDEFFYKKQWREALQSYERALAIDPTYSWVLFQMAEINRIGGRFQKAKELYERARDYDAIISRAPKEIYDILERVTAEGGGMIDIEPSLARHVEGGIMGEPIIEDNVHLSLEGQADAGKEIAVWLIEHVFAPHQGRPEEVRSFAEMAPELDITDDVRVRGLLRVAAYFGNRFEYRIHYAEQAYQLQPENVTVLRMLAWSYLRANRRNEAARLYEQLAQLYPDLYRQLAREQTEISELLKSPAVRSV